MVRVLSFQALVLVWISSATAETIGGGQIMSLPSRFERK
jgi:hypothetical protein